jgi:kynurenine formamidase
MGPGPSDVHKIVLGAGGVIAENLTNLDALVDDSFTVSLLPLNLHGSDGSPIRAVAWKEE